MILFINTTKPHEIEVSLKEGEIFVVKKNVKTNYDEAEKLIPTIDKILKAKKKSWKDVEKIIVNNYGGSFTSLRIGVVTANALGFAFGIPVEGSHSVDEEQKNDFSVVEAVYDRKPNITSKKS